ncbi:hypothetical protein MSS93_15080 [Deinococcus radiodurans]|nr:hypothetical protein MSS93_15080 [Deinococcus radiodurans]
MPAHDVPQRDRRGEVVTHHRDPPAQREQRRRDKREIVLGERHPVPAVNEQQGARCRPGRLEDVHRLVFTGP